MKNPINVFWDWYKTKILESVIFLLIVHILQIPHWIWSHSLFGSETILSSLPLWLDYLFWSVDLIEIPSLINVIFLFILYVQERRSKLK